MIKSSLSGAKYFELFFNIITNPKTNPNPKLTLSEDTGTPKLTLSDDSRVSFGLIGLGLGLLNIEEKFEMFCAAKRGFPHQIFED